MSSNRTIQTYCKRKGLILLSFKNSSLAVCRVRGNFGYFGRKAYFLIIVANRVMLDATESFEASCPTFVGAIESSEASYPMDAIESSVASYPVGAAENFEACLDASISFVAYLKIFASRETSTYPGIVFWKRGFVACLITVVFVRMVITRRKESLIAADHRASNDCCSKVIIHIVDLL